MNLGWFRSGKAATKAGLNLPEIFFDLALKGKKPTLSKIINPLPDGLLWIRSMDKEPLLTSLDDVLGRVIQSDSDGNFL
jgi:carbamoyl-phosphate synthase large subunit